MELNVADVACPLRRRDSFLEVGIYLGVESVEPLAAACADCANFAGDAALGEAFLAQRPGWREDFDASNVTADAAITAGGIRCGVSVERAAESAVATAIRQSFKCSPQVKYCRRRMRLRRLVTALPELLRTWRCEPRNSEACFDDLPPALAAVLSATSAVQGQGDINTLVLDGNAHEVATDNPFENVLNIFANDGEAEGSWADGVRCSGDLVEVLAVGPGPLHCGPLSLFDRLELVHVNFRHEVDLVVEQLRPDLGDDGEPSDSDDEDPSMVHRFPAALAEWSVSSLDELRRTFIGSVLLAPPCHDPLALNPVDPETLQRSADGERVILLVERGQVAFIQKVRNSEAGGAAGVVVCDNVDGPLFRMAAGADLSSSALEAFLPAVLISASASNALQTLLRQGPVKVRRVEVCRQPRAFVCIGSAQLSSSQSSAPMPANALSRLSSQMAEDAEIWVVSDERAIDSLGAVLWVPRTGDATVLAPSIFALLSDVISLDALSAHLLEQAAPHALRALRGDRDTCNREASGSTTMANARNDRALREADLRALQDFMRAARPSHGAAVQPVDTQTFLDGDSAGERLTEDEANNSFHLGGHVVAAALTAAMMAASVTRPRIDHSRSAGSTRFKSEWDGECGTYVTAVPGCKISRGWLQVEGSLSTGPELFRVLHPLKQTDLQSALELSTDPGPSSASTTAFDASSSVSAAAFVSLFDGEELMLDDSCVLVEEQADGNLSVSQSGERHSSWRRKRGYRGKAAVFDRIMRIAPSHVKQRWIEVDGGESLGSTCTVSVRNGQLCVRWISPSGYRSCFQKPVQNLYKFFIEVPDMSRSSRVLHFGESVLLSTGRSAAGDTCVSVSSCSNELADGGESSHTGSPGQDCGLEEPDGVWCWRGRRPPDHFNTRGSQGKPEREVDMETDVVERDERVTLLQARPGPRGCLPVTLRLDLSALERLRFLPSPWLLRAFSNGRQHEEPQVPASIPSSTPGVTPTDIDNSMSNMTSPDVDTSFGTSRNSSTTAPDGIVPGLHGASEAPFVAMAADQDDSSVLPSTMVSTPSHEGCGVLAPAAAVPWVETPCGAQYLLSEISADCLRLEVPLEAHHSLPGELALDVSARSVRISVGAVPPGTAALPARPLEIPLPFEVDPTTARARFSKSNRCLIVRLSRTSN